MGIAMVLVNREGNSIPLNLENMVLFLNTFCSSIKLELVYKVQMQWHEDAIFPRNSEVMTFSPR
ncbi:unnamed protein product [Brassica oleracea var. botrytis]